MEWEKVKEIVKGQINHLDSRIELNQKAIKEYEMLPCGETRAVLITLLRAENERYEASKRSWIELLHRG